MLPGEKKPALVRTWNGRKCLILEEVSMISPPFYNFLLYRSYFGRSETHQVGEPEYDKRKGAFGRMPLVLHLGDFLQLKPTGSAVSIIASLEELQSRGELKGYPAEWQQAMTLFKQTPLCFELQASNRFTDPRMRRLMDFMRHPTGKRVPQDIATSWESLELGAGDERMRQERFQTGHMLAIYWETVARWMMMRARRDAVALQTPLFLLQAADHAVPHMPTDMAKKLMNKANPKDTGMMHGMLAVHLGMRVRLLDALDRNKALVKDAEGEVVRIEVNPMDQEAVDEAMANGGGTVYLRHVPFGIWLRMDKYSDAPFCKRLQRLDGSLDPADTQRLVFVEPTTSEPFIFRNYKITRTGFTLSHARVITATACQGRTFRLGVVIDCGRHEGGSTAKEDEDWWLDLYVMLSRATRLDDLLLIRPPPADFLLRGPPKDLQKQLAKFAKRTAMCRADAAKVAQELGFTEFLHGEG